jgi:RNA polymerase sigma factor (sigma-70 family)
VSRTTAAPPGLGKDLSPQLTALRSGEPGGLAYVFRSFAAGLYDYAYGLLADRRAAEDAVHDALLVSVSRSARLVRPDQIRPWLYALTRNEALRQARRLRPATPHRDPDERDHTVQFGSDLLVQQARAWVRDAAAGLEPLEREALDLTHRHEFPATDIAAILGVPVKRAAALIASGKESLERTLDVLLTSRAGHGACPQLDDLLSHWDGLFTPPVREKVGKHMSSCRNCAGVTWDYGGAVELFSELAAEPLPSLLERRVLATAAVPSRVMSRAEIAEPFARSGFPVPLDRGNEWRRPLMTAAVVLVLAIVGGTTIYLMRPDPREWSRLDAANGPVAPLPSPAHSEAPKAISAEQFTPSPGPSASPQPSPSVTAVASARPLEAPAAPPSPKASAPAVPTGPGALPVEPADPNRPTQTQVDSLFADSTQGCPRSAWTGTATTYVRGGEADAVTFFWGESPTALPHAVPLAKAQTVMYQATVTGLPMNTAVHWRVVATMADGQRIATSTSSITHNRQC